MATARFSVVPTSDEERTTVRTCCGSDNLKALWGLFVLNTSFALIQLIGAVIANSLSMFSDSGSMLVDSFAYLANIVLERRKHLLGAKAVKLWEIITSVITVGLLVIVTVIAIVDAFSRLNQANSNDGDQSDVNGRLVFAFAVGNLVLDVIMCSNYFYQLRHRQRQQTLRDQVLQEAKEELNMVSAFVHLFADTLRTLTSMVAGVLEDRLKDDAVSIDSFATFLVCSAILLAGSFVFYEAYQQYQDYLSHPSNEVVESVIATSQYVSLVDQPRMNMTV